MAEPLGSKIGSAFIEVTASLVGFGKSLAADVTNAIVAESFVLGQALENFGQAVFTKFSLPLLAATGANIAQFQALDREIRTVLTLFGTAPSLVEDTFGEMAAGVRSVSIEVGGLEKDISEGLYQAISAGVPRGGVFDFLDVAQMAAVADRTADLTTAVDGLTTVINAFGLESTDAERAADVMFQTVALGKTTFGELSQDIGRVAPLAANAGVSFEELFAIIGALTLQGLKTSEAISFLRASITGLLRPTDELNAVFERAGFVSAEAAVPVIGLQDAFQLVFDAVGGSTSQMQELIGTSEGVSAILGVTGQNADTFGRIMGGVENSTGAATRAFEIMDESVGRSFGRLTEAFDRLGNTFGEMASQFAQPVLDSATGILNRMVEVFSNFRPIVSGLADAFGGFIQLLNAPILRDIVAIFTALGISIFGMIGSLGLFSLTLGKVILAGLQIKAVAAVFKGLNVVLTFSRLAIQGVGTSMVTTAAQMRAGGIAASVASRPIGLLGKAFTATRFATLAAGAAFLGIGALIAGAVAGIGALIKANKEYVESQDVFGKQTDKLIESLGLLNQEIQVPGAVEGQGRLAEFQQQNLELLNIIRNVKDELGRLAASDVLEAIAVELVFKGNSPEEVLESMKQIETLTGISINLDTSDLEDANVLLSEFGEGVIQTGRLIENRGGFQGIRAQVDATAEGIVKLFQASAATGDAQTFIDTLNTIREDLDLTGAQANSLGRAIERAFGDEFEGVDLVGFFENFFSSGAALENLLDPEELLRRLAEAGIEIPEITIPVRPELPPDYDPTTDLPFATEGFGLGEGLFEQLTTEQLEVAKIKARELGLEVHEVVRISDQGVTNLEGLFQSTEGLFSNVKDQVLGAMGEIRASIEAQNPLLDIYSGKVDQSFSAWKKGQDQFQEDLKAVTTLRDRLVEENLPQELIAAFDRQPIEKQAWLAGLGEKQLEEALAELAESFELIDENAKERVLQSFGTIMEEAGVTITEGFVVLQNEAAAAGPIVAERFREEFDKKAALWEGTARSYMTAIENQLSRELAGPRVGPIQFSGGTFGAGGQTVINNNTVINNPNTQSPEQSAEKVNAINSTHGIGPN